jgi:CRAL/TRIO domain
VWILTAPSIFSVAFSIVRPFLHENTVKKIQIFSSNSRKWKAALLDNIGPEQLPVHYGGTQMGPDGDTKCIHKVTQFYKSRRRHIKDLLLMCL